MKKFFGLLFFVMFISGCATFSSVMYTDNIYAPTDPLRVKVFSNKPPQEYISIGEVSAKGASTSSRSNMIEQLKTKAAEMGGDAIILQTAEVAESIMTDTNSSFMTSNIQRRPVMNGVVIKFSE